MAEERQWVLVSWAQVGPQQCSLEGQVFWMTCLRRRHLLASPCAGAPKGALPVGEWWGGRQGELTVSA